MNIFAVAGVEEVMVATWVFTAHEPDVTEALVSRGSTAHPEYGPGGADCERGVRVDGTRYDAAFTCDCAGTG